MKKKVILTGLLMILVIAMTGCGSKENVERVVCKNTVQLDENITLASEYTAYAVDGNVTVLASTEAIKSDNEEKLNEYKQTLEEVYTIYNQVPYYYNRIDIEEGYLYSITTINYERINTDDLIKIDENNKQLISKGKVKLKNLKEMYEEAGATCE